MENYKKSDYYREIILEKIRFGLQNIVSKSIIENLELDVGSRDFISDSVIYELRGFLLGEELKDEYCDIPINWWQMLKEQHFPRWLLKKFPVKYKRAFLNIKAVYPKLNIYLPKGQNKFIYAIQQYESDNLE